MSNPTKHEQCYEGRGGITGRHCNFYPKCICGDRDALSSLRTPQGEPALTSNAPLRATREPVVIAPQGNAGESPALPNSAQERAAPAGPRDRALLTSNQCCACERAMSVLQLYGVPPQRARNAANGIEVLMTRSRKEAVAVNATIENLRTALKDLSRAYISMMETGRDRIIALGGDCDPVDVMERGDPYLRKAREALSGDSSAPETGAPLAEAARLLRALRDDYGKGGEKYRAITAWLNHNEPPAQETNEHSAKGLASAGSSAAVNPRDTVGGSAEPSGRPVEDYCVCQRSYIAEGQRGFYCKTCGKDLHPDNYFSENGKAE